MGCFQLSWQDSEIFSTPHSEAGDLSY